jgi:predicted glycoside hydrolase/deacetylase ChbG (UPF0249 family)
MEPLLIVNADDFGLTDGVCTAILRASEDGVVTSTSALVNAPAFARHARALRNSGLGVGAHLCVVGEDPPILSAHEVPTLVDRSGRFPLTWKEFMLRAATGRVDIDDLRVECRAQMEVITAAGLSVTHIDSHQNLHLWPQVATVAFEIAKSHGIGAIRMTRSSKWSLSSMGVRTLAGVLATRSRRHGMVFPKASTGLDEAGALSEPAMVEALNTLRATGADSAELATHPGMAIDPDRRRYEWNYQWAEEFEAVSSPLVRTTIDRLGFRLGSFADLVAMAPATTNPDLRSP